MPCHANCLEWNNADAWLKWVNQKELVLENSMCIWQEERHFFDHNSDKCLSWASECKVCEGYSDFCIECQNTEFLPVNGKCGCVDHDKIMDEEGKWVWRPGYYNDDLMDWHKLWQKLILNDNFRDEPLVINKHSNPMVIFMV